MQDQFTFEQVDGAVSYDAATGLFSWKAGNRRARAGTHAGGSAGQGYLCLSIGGVRCKAHRAAWLLTHGGWPEGVIDHINGIRSDNRLENLRAVSAATNRENQQRVRSDSSTGFLGVIKAGNRYRACIRSEGRHIYFGTFDEPEAAHAAYLAGKRIHHSGFAG